MHGALRQEGDRSRRTKASTDAVRPIRQRRSAPPASRHAAPAARKPQRVPLRAPKLRVRWERVGRFGLLFVLVIVVGLYAEHTLSYLSTRAQADQQKAIVDRLAHQNAASDARR